MRKTAVLGALILLVIVAPRRLSAQPGVSASTNAPTPNGVVKSKKGSGTTVPKTYGDNPEHNAPTPGGGGGQGGQSTYGLNAEHNAPTPGGGGGQGGQSTYGLNAEHNAPTPGGGGSSTGTHKGSGKVAGPKLLSTVHNYKVSQVPPTAGRPNDSLHKRPAH
jgi:hypothetical protein